MSEVAGRFLTFDRAEWAALRAATPLTLTDADLDELRGVNVSVDLDEVTEIYLPVTRLLNLYVVGHVLLAAAGAYVLARRLAATTPAAGLAALVYAFSGAVLFQHSNVPFLVGAAWLP